MTLYKNTKMSEAVSKNKYLLLVLERLGIRLGVGDKTIAEVCKEYDLNPNTFLIIANVYSKGAFIINIADFDTSDIGILVNYLNNSHGYYINEKAENISRILKSKTQQSDDEYTKAIVKFFNNYVAEIKEHFNYEETIVFPHLLELINSENINPQKYNSKLYKANHTDIEEKLSDFKNLLIKYIPSNYDNILKRNVLTELFELETDLNMHSLIEENILMPIIDIFENKKENS